MTRATLQSYQPGQRCGWRSHARLEADRSSRVCFGSRFLESASGEWPIILTTAAKATGTVEKLRNVVAAAFGSGESALRTDTAPKTQELLAFEIYCGSSILRSFSLKYGECLVKTVIRILEVGFRRWGGQPHSRLPFWFFMPLSSTRFDAKG